MGSGIFLLSPVRTTLNLLKREKTCGKKKFGNMDLENLGTLEHGTTGLAYFFLLSAIRLVVLSVFSIF